MSLKELIIGDITAEWMFQQGWKIDDKGGWHYENSELDLIWYQNGDLYIVGTSSTFVPKTFDTIKSLDLIMRALS